LARVLAIDRDPTALCRLDCPLLSIRITG